MDTIYAFALHIPYREERGKSVYAIFSHSVQNRRISIDRERMRKTKTYNKILSNCNIYQEYARGYLKELTRLLNGVERRTKEQYRSIMCIGIVHKNNQNVE